MIINEDDIDEIGEMLEDKGLSHAEIDLFFEHHGVKGMHWGIRGTRRAQKRIDRINRQATGKASAVDRLLNANRFVFTQKGANRQLQRGANQQAKVKAGKKKIFNMLLTLHGVKIKNLDFHKKGDAKAKLDSGQKAALAVLAVGGALNVAAALSHGE